MSGFFDKNSRFFKDGLSEEARRLKIVLGDCVGREFTYKKTCGMCDLTYTVDNQYIVKFESPKTTHLDLKRLASLTRILRADARVTFDIPDMAGAEFETPDGGIFYAVWYPKIDGTIIPFHQMDTYRSMGKRRQQQMNPCMEQLGIFMAQMHSVPVMSVAHLFPESFAGKILNAVQQAVPELAMDKKQVREQVSWNVLKTLCPGYDEVLCHNDLNLWNIIRRPDDTIAGVIDFGMARIGCPSDEARYWDYFDTHRRIIEQAYLAHRGVQFQHREEPLKISAHKPDPAQCRQIYQQVKARAY